MARESDLFRDLKLRLRALVTPNRVERDLHDELSFHIEREARKLIDQGMPPDRARAQARARFGSTTVVADECRDERGTAFVDDTIRDIRFSLRSFRRAPLTALTIVGTVAIGLGVVATLFTILNRFLFHVDPTVPGLHELYAVERRPQGNGDPSPFTRPAFEALRRETGVFTGVYAAVFDIDLRVDGRMMSVTLVTGNFLDVVRVKPLMGRGLAPADDEAGGQRVIVLSDKGWDRHFKRDPHVLGRTVLVGGTPFEIVGVMPAGFRGLEFSAPDFWAPLAQRAQFEPGSRGREDDAGGVGGVGETLRLEHDSGAGTQPKDMPPIPSRLVTVVGVSRDVAGFRFIDTREAGIFLPTSVNAPKTFVAARLNGDSALAYRTLADRLTSVDPNMGLMVTMKTLASLETSFLRIAFWVSLALGALALLLTVSGLFSVLSYLVEQRTREIGVRMALGASPGNVTRLILRQTTRPVLYGLLAGVGLAASLATLLIAMPGAAGITEIVRLTDPIAYVASLLTIVAACLLAAWLPATRAARLDPMHTLRQD